jgi:hypothetical protein
MTVPAPVWHGGFFRRALTIGVATGTFLGALAWLDSGMFPAGVLVFLIVGTVFGVMMARRMARYWPCAIELTGTERVTVVHVARRGERIGDARLAQAVIDYNQGLHAAAEKARPFRWLVWFVLAVAVGTAVWDTVFGSARDGVASGVYLALLGFELFWWLKQQARLLSNADRAAEMARQMQFSD